MADASRFPVPPYGSAIHQAITGGDLDEMRQTAGDAEDHLAEVTRALEKLKAAIAEKEGGARG